MFIDSINEDFLEFEKIYIYFLINVFLMKKKRATSRLASSKVRKMMRQQKKWQENDEESIYLINSIVFWVPWISSPRRGFYGFPLSENHYRFSQFYKKSRHIYSPGIHDLHQLTAKKHHTKTVTQFSCNGTYHNTLRIIWSHWNTRWTVILGTSDSLIVR